MTPAVEVATCPRCAGPVRPCPVAADGLCAGMVHQAGGTHHCPQPCRCSRPHPAGAVWCYVCDRSLAVTS